MRVRVRKRGSFGQKRQDNDPNGGVVALGAELTITRSPHNIVLGSNSCLHHSSLKHSDDMDQVFFFTGARLMEEQGRADSATNIKGMHEQEKRKP